MSTIAIVDYGMGNRRSVQKAFEHVGARVVLTGQAADIRAADGVVVPGVGAFPEAMRRLSVAGLDAVIRDAAADGTPVFGICLGMQLLFESSSEHEGSAGLGLIPGHVTALDPGAGKLPHIGWTEVELRRSSAVTGQLRDSAAFYHVHSFVCRPADPDDAVGIAEYGERFASIVEHGLVSGAQFHPEKSSHAGLTMLKSFVDACTPVATVAA